MNLQNSEHTGSSFKKWVFSANTESERPTLNFIYPQIDEMSFHKIVRFNTLIPSYEFPLKAFFPAFILLYIEFRQPQIVPIKMQIEFLRKKIGFNISEIAEILLVARPTIYSWLEPVDAKLHHANQQRLDSIYDFFLTWDSKFGRIGSYLYKTMSNERRSLFELLKEKNLDKQRIYNIIDQIQHSIKMQHTENNLRVKFLKDHGFEEVSKEAREDNLNNFIRSVGLNEKNNRKA